MTLFYGRVRTSTLITLIALFQRYHQPSHPADPREIIEYSSDPLGIVSHAWAELTYSPDAVPCHIGYTQFPI